jgi:hypothetical protein
MLGTGRAEKDKREKWYYLPSGPCACLRAGFDGRCVRSWIR